MLVIFKSQQDNKMTVTEGLFYLPFPSPLHVYFTTHLKTF